MTPISMVCIVMLAGNVLMEDGKGMLSKERLNMFQDIVFKG